MRIEHGAAEVDCRDPLIMCWLEQCVPSLSFRCMKSALALECRTIRGSEHYIWQLSKDKCKAGGCSLQVVSFVVATRGHVNTCSWLSKQYSISSQVVEVVRSECFSFNVQDIFEKHQCFFGRPFLVAMWCGARWTCRLWILRYRAQLQMQLTCQIWLPRVQWSCLRPGPCVPDVSSWMVNSASAMYHQWSMMYVRIIPYPESTQVPRHRFFWPRNVVTLRTASIGS